MEETESSKLSSTNLGIFLPQTQQPRTTSSKILADANQFVTPERDPRKYRVIELPNNLQVLLVCDEMKSGIGVEAASVHVQAGHMDDTIPGLARKWLFELLNGECWSLWWHRLLFPIWRLTLWLLFSMPCVEMVLLWILSSSL